MVPDDQANSSHALPVGWRWTTIGEHYRFKNGLSKAKRFFGQGTPIINYMDVFNHQRLGADHVQGKVTVTGDEIKSYSAKQGDVFFTRTSETVSEIGMASVLLEPIENTVFSGFVLRGRPANDDINPHFAAYALRAGAVRKQIELRATYTTRALTNGRSISEVTFPLPGKEDQRAIAQALTDIDDLIASLDALIAKKRAIRQGAMQQLLTGKRRLLGFAGEWQTRNIRDIAELDPENLGASTPPNWEFNYISLEDISRGDQLGHVSVTFGNAPSRARRKIRSGDILFGTVRPNLQSHCLFAREDGPWIASTGFCVVRCRDNEADPGFIFHQLMGREVAAQIERIIAGSNYPAVSSRDVGALAIATPSLDEQQAISALIGEMTEEIAVLASKKKKTETIRQGMMQQLLTGRTRLA